MERKQIDLYYKGYIAGYRDGIKDAVNGKTLDLIEYNVRDLPVKSMGVSTRAYNCLTHAGCVHISDVVALSESSIATMRSLGVKTAAEIARWLDSHGICYSAWSKYL